MTCVLVESATCSLRVKEGYIVHRNVGSNGDKVELTETSSHVPIHCEVTMHVLVKPYLCSVA